MKFSSGTYGRGVVLSDAPQMNPQIAKLYTTTLPRRSPDGNWVISSCHDQHTHKSLQPLDYKVSAPFLLVFAVSDQFRGAQLVQVTSIGLDNHLLILEDYDSQHKTLSREIKPHLTVRVVTLDLFF